MSQNRYVIKSTYKDGTFGYCCAVRQQDWRSDTKRSPNATIALFTAKQAALCLKMKEKDFKLYGGRSWNIKEECPLYKIIWIGDI